MSKYVGKVLIYGASGALGKECIRHFKQAQWLTIGVGTSMDDSVAEKKIQINKKDNIQDQETAITKQLNDILIENEKLDAVITTAGGWQGGKVNSSEFLSSVANLVESNLNPACASAAVASKFLKANGLLVFFGASAALGPTPDMIAYGMIKAAIHQLVRSLGAEGAKNGLAKDVCSIAVLPAILDTPDNRKWLKNMDATTFTPLGFLAETFEKWAKNTERPPNGALLKLITVNKDTTFETV